MSCGMVLTPGDFNSVSLNSSNEPMNLRNLSLSTVMQFLETC